MTTPSLHQQTGLSLNVFEPLVSGTQFIETITHKYSQYEHELSAFGGYDRQNFTIAGNQDEIEEWLDKGLGRRIITKNPGQDIVFESFVNSVEISVGPLTAKRGPLFNVSNRVQLVYSTIDTAVDPPTLGNRERTAEVNDADSQIDFGIIQNILSSGGLADGEATQIVDTFIEEHRELKTTKESSNFRTSDPIASIECLGYGHWLKAYVYNQTAAGGDQDLTAKLQAIITADPNSFLSTDFARITANALQVAQWENDDNVAWDLVKSLTAKGDATSNRYTYGVYADRQSIYEAAPTTALYRQRVSQNNQQVEFANGTEVDAWDVLPAKWLIFPDFLIGSVAETDIKKDARAMFIEKVFYRAPYGLSLDGSLVETLPQKLAQLGLAGISA